MSMWTSEALPLADMAEQDCLDWRLLIPVYCEGTCFVGLVCGNREFIACQQLMLPLCTREMLSWRLKPLKPCSLWLRNFEKMGATKRIKLNIIRLVCWHHRSWLVV